MRDLSRWLAFAGIAALAFAGCVTIAWFAFPWDLPTRVAVGSSAGVVVGAVIAAWATTRADPPAVSADRPAARAEDADIPAVQTICGTAAFAIQNERGTVDLRNAAITVHQGPGTAPGSLSVAVSVDSVPPDYGRPIDPAPERDVRYRAVRQAGRLVVTPSVPYLDLVARGGPIEPYRTWSFALPALDVKVVNNTGDSVFFHEALFRVASSRTDPRPVPTTYTAPGPYLRLSNQGWGPMRERRLRFHLEVGGDPRPLTREYTWNLDDAEDAAPLEAALAEAGIDPDSPPTVVAMVDHAIVGVLDYEQTEPDGSVTRRSLRLRAGMRFGIARVEAMHIEPTHHYHAPLRADGQDYEIRVPVSQALVVGESDRFRFVIAAERSSLHDFHLALLDTEGGELTCGRVSLEIFVPAGETWRLERDRPTWTHTE
jgi:hypothetical protein